MQSTQPHSATTESLVFTLMTNDSVVEECGHAECALMTSYETWVIISIFCP